MASIFRQQYTMKDATGKTVHKQSKFWYIDYKAGRDGQRKRVKGFKDKTATTQLAAKLEREAELADAGIVDRFKEHRLRPLSEYLEEFRKSLGDTTKHARCTYKAVKKAFDACKFYRWGDISASKFLGYLNTQKKECDMSQRTFNAYVKAGKQFCKWAVQDQRAAESPLQHLKCETITQRKRTRRALELDEIRGLLATTQAAPERFGLTGYERALLYRLAVETGLRASELRSLTVSSFDFAARTVTVTAANAKNKREGTLPLRADTAAELQGFFTGKLPTALAFKVPEKTADMLKADLAEAGIEYVDDSGRVFDFHALRGQCASLLAASGAHPKTAQTILRHSDVNLTLNAYTHTLRGQESEAVENLPDLSFAGGQSQRATGTDGAPVGTDKSAYKPAYKKLAKNSDFPRNPLSSVVAGRGAEPANTEQRGQGGKALQSAHLGTQRDLLSPTGTEGKTNGRCRNRTCDPLIKSQLLYQLS